MIDTYISGHVAALASYAVEKGLIEPADRVWAVNAILEAMGLTEYEEPGTVPQEPLEDILGGLVDFSVKRGLIQEDITSRDLLDTKLMGILTPRPSQVISVFREKYQTSSQAATDWYYALSQDSDYIRRYRIAKDVKWLAPTEYGDLDITINLSKPEKDPRAIAAAKAAPQS